jgi:glycosyltransferase involved in cell wall biosynthesis
MKIVQVLTRLGAGGPPIQTVMLTREMTRIGNPSTLVTGSLDRQDRDMSYLLRQSDRVHWIPEMSRAVSPWRDLRALISLYRFLRRERPSIVHTHTAKAGVLGRLAAWMAGVPVVVHTFHGNVLSHYFSRPVNWAICQIERALAKLTDGICVLAPQQASELADRRHIVSRDKIHLVPLGMDLAEFSLLGPAPRRGGVITAGWMGRFVPIKDIPLLLAAARETLRRTDRVRFVIAGDGPEAPLVKALADEFGPARFRWLGWREDVAAVLAECDLLIQTSRNEGTPGTLIQGMAARRPFISTPAGGVVDMVAGPLRRQQGGCRWFDNGVLADPTPAAFAAALCEFAANPHEIARMGALGAEFALENYSLSTMVKSLTALYSALLEQEAPVLAR